MGYLKCSYTHPSSFPLREWNVHPFYLSKGGEVEPSSVLLPCDNTLLCITSCQGAAKRLPSLNGQDKNVILLFRSRDDVEGAECRQCHRRYKTERAFREHFCMQESVRKREEEERHRRRMYSSFNFNEKKRFLLLLLLQILLAEEGSSPHPKERSEHSPSRLLSAWLAEHRSGEEESVRRKHQR